MPSDPIRLILIDAHRLLLEALELRLQSVTGIEVVGSSTKVDIGLRLVARRKPHIVLMDVEGQERDPFRVAREIRKLPHQTHVMFLTDYNSDVLLERALTVQPCSYLLKSESMTYLLRAVREAASGQAVFSRPVRARLRYDAARKGYRLRSPTPFSRLTPRQLEVLRYLARGYAVRDAAELMEVSAKSVDSHKYRVMQKLDIHDRVQLARFAIREGLTTP